MTPFIYVGNWFDRKYRQLDGRFFTMKAALNLYLQRTGKLIVETGCARQEDDWGAGMSTVAFADVCNAYGGQVITVDNSEAHLQTCVDMLAKRDLGKFVTPTCSDSVRFFDQYQGEPIDLLYLDSYDYPYGDLLNAYGGREDIHKAMKVVDALPMAEVREKFIDIINPCQQHCLREMVAASKHLTVNSIVLIDDNSLAGGGKSYLAKEWLWDHAWECLFDGQQTLWIKE